MSPIEAGDTISVVRGRWRGEGGRVTSTGHETGNDGQPLPGGEYVVFVSDTTDKRRSTKLKNVVKDGHCISCDAADLYSTWIDADGNANDGTEGVEYATFCNNCGEKQP